MSQSLGTDVWCACLIFCLPSYSHVYKRSYPSPRCACGGRAERPQMVYMNDNTSLIHQINFWHNLNPCAHPRWLVEWSSTLWSIKLWPSIPKLKCYFNRQVIGSPRSISLARNVEKRHRFWGARALGSWQSIQIACRLQESVREDTGRRVLHVVRIELTARSHILVSWSVYPNYEYHYFTMYLVHLWLVEINVAWSASVLQLSGRPVAKCDP